MFPGVRFLQLSLYEWCSIIGVIAAIVVFRVYADRKKIGARLQIVCLGIAVVSIAVGYGFAVLFQAVYDFTASGVFVIDKNTGMTFYGGLIGGAAAFLALYSTVARKLCRAEAKERFGDIVGIAACSVAVAHACGRVGCLMAGCCYGRETQSWVGIYLPAVGKTVIPTQLFEAIFLACLFAALSVLLFRTKISGIAVYCMAYGVFRFVIEFWRADDRGASVIPGLSPSQCWSIVLFCVGAAIVIASAIRAHRRRGDSGADTSA